jgi:hypothetical protein
MIAANFEQIASPAGMVTTGIINVILLIHIIYKEDMLPVMNAFVCERTFISL